MAGGLGLVGRQGNQNARAKLSGKAQSIAHTDMAAQSVQHMQSALDTLKKTQAEQKVTQAGG